MARCNSSTVKTLSRALFIFPSSLFLLLIVVVAAAAKGGEYLDRKLAGPEIVVIGDTPRDVACGKHIGARTLAVATGGATLEALQACEPDWAVADLTHLSAAEVRGG